MSKGGVKCTRCGGTNTRRSKTEPAGRYCKDCKNNFVKGH